MKMDIIEKEYKRLFESGYNDNDPDNEYLFKAQSQGGKAWIKIYQSEQDKKRGW
jgi:hypothetical protein